MAANHLASISSFDLLVAADCPSDWRICIGLRGHLGYRLEDGPESLADFLVPLFHQNHDLPSPFRLAFLPDPLLPQGLHRIRVFTYGNQSEILQQLLASFMANDSGILRGDQTYPFQIKAVAGFRSGCLPFPSNESDDLMERCQGPFELISTSPFFSRNSACGLFREGLWTERLAIRFADLIGIRRQELSSLAPKIPAKEESISRQYRLAFGGKKRQRSGLIFTV